MHPLTDGHPAHLTKASQGQRHPESRFPAIWGISGPFCLKFLKVRPFWGNRSERRISTLPVEDGKGRRGRCVHAVAGGGADPAWGWRRADRPPAGEAYGPLGKQPWLQSKYRALGSQEEVWAKPKAVRLQRAPTFIGARTEFS